MQQREVTVSKCEAKARFPNGSRGNVARLGAAAVLWIALAAPLHFMWEWAHAPFYALWVEGSRWVIAYSVAHCTAGDVLIAGASYLIGAGYTHRVDWPRTAPGRGLAVVIPSGLVYTVFSEWLNVYRLGSWAYAESMPLIGGIGVTPLLQWLVVPLVMVFLWRVQRPGGLHDVPGKPEKEETRTIAQQRR
jgi:hypothetical protein